jgi:Fe-S cluster biogenesis protein NfuA
VTGVADRIAHVETLLGRIEHDEPALEAVQSVVELYGDALARMLQGVDPTEDELVSQLLIVHDLHPLDVETRARRALEDVRPYLGSHGGDVEFLGVEAGVAHVRLAGTCNGCPSSTVTLRNAIEEAMLRAAPELERVEAEGVVEPPPEPLLQIGGLQCPTELSAR